VFAIDALALMREERRRELRWMRLLVRLMGLSSKSVLSRTVRLRIGRLFVRAATVGGLSARGAPYSGWDRFGNQLGVR
jgi:hypothetical protein